MNDSATKPTRVPIPERIKEVELELQRLLDGTPDTPMCRQWEERWKPTLDRILEETDQRPQVVISLMGGTGAGKSTLVNALLDARILPVSNMRACTAAISEISYHPGDEYRARVEFISRESWHREFKLLLDDLKDAQASSDDEDDSDAIVIPRIAKDKLRIVYGPWKTDDLPSYDIADYSEPPEVTEALDSGRINIASQGLEDFRKRIREYLDSKGRFWPLVKTVKISGPFSALECGAKLVDLPGINDPNAARESVTKKHLKSCQFVWVVFNIKRVLTKDVSNLMQSDDFVRQIVMDGREHALTFVGTASDDIDVDSAAEEFGVDEDSSISELGLARNEAVRLEVKMQVSDIADRLARNAQSPDRAENLTSSFLKSRILTVSARDYLALKKLAKNRPNFEDIEDTEINALRQHMIQTCSKFGPLEQARVHHARIDNVLNEIKAEATRGASAIDQKRQMSKAALKELSGAISRLRLFLQRDLEDHQQRFEQELSSGREVLAERIKRATERGRHELELVVGQWRRMHWCTLRAVARRRGRFNSPSTGEHDFAADVAKPILDGITFSWTDFFGDRLTGLLDKWSTKLVSLAQRHGLDLLTEVGRLKLGAQSTIQKDFESVVKTTERVIREQVGQIQSEMNQRIDEVRRTLYERIPEQVATDMAAGFDAAAQESGKGVKQRMIEHIATHAHRVAGDMFHDMEEKIGQGVRSLNQWLGGKYRDMRGTVERHAAIPADNLLGAGGESEEELDARRSALSAIAQAAEALMDSRDSVSDTPS